MPTSHADAAVRDDPGIAVRRAVVAQTVLAIYLQVIEWVPLFPWNDLSRGNGQETMDLIIGAVSLALIVGAAMRSRVALGTAVVGLAAWLVLQIQSWWVPYVTGGSASWRRVYDRWFSRTWRFLPDWGDHPVPDAAHTVLHVLILIALVASAVAWWRLKVSARKPM